MTQEFRLPLPKLANARTLEYAVLGEKANYSGHSSLFVDGVELGPVPCLAICQAFGGDEFFLLHCDSDWNVLGVASYSSVEEAKKHASKTYPGVAEKWTAYPTGRVETKTVPQTDQVEFRCAICSRGPEEVTSMIEAGSTRICDRCIRELYRVLTEKE